MRKSKGFVGWIILALFVLFFLMGSVVALGAANYMHTQVAGLAPGGRPIVGGGIAITGTGKCAIPIPGATEANVISWWRDPARHDLTHRGLDFTFGNGTPVVSVMAGVVVRSEDEGFGDGTGVFGSTAQNGGLGNRIMIDHRNGIWSDYHHLRSGKKYGVTFAAVGTEVAKGQQIGEVDSNGWSSGNHLHFQLMHSANIKDDFNPVGCLNFKDGVRR